MQLDFRKVKGLYDWESANEYFKNTKQPTARGWDADSRPLRDARSPHLKITKEGTNSYALRLYDKKIVQYHKPGMRRVVEIFNPTHHTANYRFMANAGWHYGRRVRTDSDNADLIYVCLPFLPSSEPEGLCAYLEFKQDGKLVLNDSWVLRFYRKTADASVKEHNRVEKKRVSKQLETIVTLLMLHLDGYTPDILHTQNMLKLDRQGRLPSNKLPLWALQAYVNRGIPLEENDWKRLMEYARRVADLKRTLGKEEPVTEKELLDKLAVAVGNMKSGTGKKAMPMWHAKKLPRCGHFQTRAEADRFA